MNTREQIESQLKNRDVDLEIGSTALKAIGRSLEAYYSYLHRQSVGFATQSTKIGSAVHAILAGNDPNFEQYGEVLPAGGRREKRSEGASGENLQWKEDEVERVNNIVSSIEKSGKWYAPREGLMVIREQEYKTTRKIAGRRIVMRATPDVIVVNNKRIVDYKTCKESELTDRNLNRVIADYKYNMQLKFYADICNSVVPELEICEYEIVFVSTIPWDFDKKRHVVAAKLLDEGWIENADSCLVACMGKLDEYIRRDFVLSDKLKADAVLEAPRWLS